MKKKILVLIVIVIICIVSIIFAYILNNNKEKYIFKELNITVNNQKIYANLYRPNTKKKVPIIIYSHGLGATYRAGSSYAKELLKYDIATLTFDFRGGSDRSKSNGSTKEMSIITECDDLENIIKEVKTWDFVDQNKIILMGSSQGGAVSALVSSKHDEIAATVLLYPALSIPEVVHNWYSNIDDIPSEVKMTSSITVGKKYFADIWNLDVYSEIKKDNKKILILHGTKDSVVPINNSKKLNELYNDSEFYEIDGAGHGFDDEHLEQTVNYIIDYFKKLRIIVN